jgi:hypothetical protein
VTDVSGGNGAAANEPAPRQPVPAQTPAADVPARVEATPEMARQTTPVTSGGSGDQFLRRFVVVTVILVSSLIALVIIFATVLVPIVSTNDAPEELKNWGGLIIGFYFGTFIGLLKDWLSEPGQKGAA